MSVNKSGFNQDGMEFFHENKSLMAFIFLIPLMASPVISSIILCFADIAKNSVFFDCIAVSGGLLFLFGLLCLLDFASGLHNINFRRSSLKTLLKNNLHTILFIILLIWMLICSLKSSDFYESFIGSYYRHGGYITYLIFGAAGFCASQLKEEKYRIRLLYSFLILSVFLCIIMWCQFFRIPLFLKNFGAWGDNGKLGGMDLCSAFFNSNHYAYLLNIQILISAGLFIYDKKKKHRILFALAFIIQLITLIANDTFGAFLAVGAALVFLGFFARINNKSKILTCISPLIIFITVSILCNYTPKLYNALTDNSKSPINSNESISHNISTFKSDLVNISKNNENANHAGSARWGFYKTNLKYTLESPVFGYGSDIVNITAKDGSGVYVPKAHNELIELGFSNGLIAPLLYLAAILFIAIKQLKKLKLLPASTIISGICLIGYFASSMVGTLCYYTGCYYIVIVFLAANDTIKK